MDFRVYPQTQVNWNTPALFDVICQFSEKQPNIAFWYSNGRTFKDYKKEFHDHVLDQKVLIIFWPHGFNLDDFFKWRRTGLEEKKIIRHIILPETNPANWRTWLDEVLGDFNLSTNEEGQDIQVGDLIKKPANEAEQTCSLFVATRSSSQLSVLARIDEVKRRYREAIGSKVDKNREELIKKLEPLLADTNSSGQVWQDTEQWKSLSPRRLPRVLVIGPSGAGKSVLLQYLALRTSPNKNNMDEYRLYKRIPIPEYLGDEQRLEFDLFGYITGAYTGANPKGDPGALLSAVGGVVFFDEIGDASPRIQAKLLAFLDDYRVRPRGYHGSNGIFCPLLIVAATNRPVDDWAEADKNNQKQSQNIDYGNFRHDLFERFDVVIKLPGLNERIGDLPLLIDLLLQDEAINPDGIIKFITEAALDHLCQQDYSQGNFRQLERYIKIAIEKAKCYGRQRLILSDVDFKHFHNTSDDV
ncbi:sigma 54-interacting transcriptional regulator [Methylobacter psychrophilus]|uniref:sigma 54-interacting transcriptional regulator n=1 Tax=Methylobacter psychrophilus TaxID=96941 RepID=UPI0021D4DFD2|nr:sigma 54-interacting transcriptional regulator [Methylobacter psychrophilus]